MPNPKLSQILLPLSRDPVGLHDPKKEGAAAPNFTPAAQYQRDSCTPPLTLAGAGCSCRLPAWSLCVPSASTAKKKKKQHSHKTCLLPSVFFPFIVAFIKKRSVHLGLLPRKKTFSSAPIQMSSQKHFGDLMVKFRLQHEKLNQFIHRASMQLYVQGQGRDG